MVKEIYTIYEKEKATGNQHRPEYMNKLTQNRANIISHEQIRMLNIKTNYKKDIYAYVTLSS